MASYRERYDRQAAAAQVAAARVQSASVAAAATEALSAVTDGASDTIADLRAEIDSLDGRVTALEP